MARIRTIKHQFFQNEILAELTAETRLLFIGLWTLADKRGRLEDRPKKIKALLFPYTTDVDVDANLDNLCGAGFILRYDADINGTADNLTPVIQVVNFEKHQRVTGKEAETESRFPPCPSAPMNLQQNSGAMAEEKQTGNKRETNGKQTGNIRDDRNKERSIRNKERNTLSRTRENESHLDVDPYPFDTFWNLYGKKVDRRTCERLWAKLTTEQQAECIAKTPSYIDATPDIQYRKNPETYLRRASWENQIIKSTTNGITSKPPQADRNRHISIEEVADRDRRFRERNGLEPTSVVRSVDEQPIDGNGVQTNTRRGGLDAATIDR